VYASRFKLVREKKPDNEAFISGAQQFCKAKNFSQTQFKNAGILPYSEAFEQISGKFCLSKPFIPIWFKPILIII